MLLNRDETKQALEAIAQACYFGATRKHRILFLLQDQGLDFNASFEFLTICLDARLAEAHTDALDPWISVTPFLLAILANYDELAQDIW